ncbi:MAG: cation diffusion facilitator family transporter [Candidatus Nomurabacteria bacterium]|nr:cation diffusion facilitator family transporter [Candidatus Nomurabacteria bacterium]
MSHNTQGNKSVISALIGNVFVTIIKTIVAIFSGSASMFAESVHSFADTLNQSLLLVGLKRSKRPADESRGYGYGIERFFWSLISACGILFIGAGVTVYHSLDSLINHNSSNIHDFNYSIIFVLCLAFIVEGTTLVIALRELMGDKKLSRKIFEDADPVTLAVVYEDGAAVLGVVVALAAQFLMHFTGDNIYDSIGGIIVGLILGFLAVILIVKNHQYIIGKSLDENTTEEIIEFLLKDPCIENISEFKSVAVDINKYRIYTTVEWNGSPLYEEIYEAGDLKEEFDNIKNNFQEFAKLMFRTTDRIPRLVGNHIDKIEKKIREEFPQVAYVDIEIN